LPPGRDEQARTKKRPAAASHEPQERSEGAHDKILGARYEKKHQRRSVDEKGALNGGNLKREGNAPGRGVKEYLDQKKKTRNNGKRMRPEPRRKGNEPVVQGRETWDGCRPKGLVRPKDHKKGVVQQKSSGPLGVKGGI